MTIIIYGKVGCGACEAAKSILKRKNIPFNYIDISQGDNGDAIIADAMAAGYRTMPIIVSNGKYTSLQEVLK